MSKVITLCSGKGGTGKTTSAIALGIALNELGKTVIVVDANLTMPNIALHLGAPSPPTTLSHVLHGKASISEAIYEHHSGTQIVPGSISLSLLPNQVNKTSISQRFEQALRYLKRTADFVIIDSAPGLSQETLLSIKACNEVLIVTNPELPAITDALKTIRMATKLKKKVIGTIITRIRKDNAELAVKNVKEMLELPILAKIAEDNSVRQAIMSRNSVLLEAPRSPASQAYRKLASKIANQDYKEECSFFKKLFSWIWNPNHSNR